MNVRDSHNEIPGLPSTVVSRWLFAKVPIPFFRPLFVRGRSAIDGKRLGETMVDQGALSSQSNPQFKIPAVSWTQGNSGTRPTRYNSVH